MRNVRLRSVIKDNIKVLLFWIFIVVALLICCMTLDSADEDIVVTANHSQVNVTNCTEINGVHYDTVIVNRSKNHIHSYNVVSVKPHYPVITIVAKPSCGCRHSYTWHKRSFVDYCPHCHHYNCLVNKHKWQSRYEQELTCKYCDSDFCGVCGKTKYSWSRVYLRRA